VGDICVTDPQQTGEIKDLVENSAGIGYAPKPAEGCRKSRVDRNEADLVAVVPQVLQQIPGMDSLAPYYVETGSDESDARSAYVAHLRSPCAERGVPGQRRTSAA
jgi:hypothetical protein